IRDRNVTGVQTCALPISLRVLAGQAALAMALMGAVNAVATLAGCLPALIWWACHRPDRRWWAFTGWAALAAALASLWWLTALVRSEERRVGKGWGSMWWA